MGNGNYFAVNASYSDDYAYRRPDGTQQMFLAKVLTRKSIKPLPNNTLRLPSIMQGNTRYDTVNGPEKPMDLKFILLILMIEHTFLPYFL